MKFGVLGPLEVLDDGGRPLDVGGRQPRLVLAMLLAAGGRLVTAEAIAQELWGDDRPAAAAGTLQSYVSRLRRKFAGGGPALAWEDPGYRLEVAAGDVDYRHFEHLADEGRALLDAGRIAEASETLAAADRLWRGSALLEFRDRDFAIGLATRLDDRRLAAIEDRIDADLRLGRHAAAAGELAELVREHPLREGLRAHLALALYRSGRQADALRALDDARRTLREELGVDPGRPLRDLEAAILGHDPALDLQPRVAGAAGAAKPAATAAQPAARAAVPAARRGLIGRDAELAEVLAALDEAAHDSRVVVVEGEPGIGKTRLAEEVRAEAVARGAVVVWGRGYEGGAAPALWPWLAPMRALAAQYDTAAASLDDLLGSEAPLATGAAASRRFERFEAVAQFLEGVAEKAPVVVVLDDVQWADETSLDLLAFLSSRLERGVLLLLTVRRLEVGRNDALTDALAAVARRPGSRRLQLRGLTQAGTVELLYTLTAREIVPEVAAAIHARADGNPFYATELTRLVLEDGATDPAAAMRATVPAGVGDVIRRRLAQLPEPTRELLSVAAVIGRDIDVGMLIRMAEVPPDVVLEHLDPAIVHRLLLEVSDRPSVYRFSHALVREVLVEDLSSLRRARLHLRVADALEAAGVGDDEAEVVAGHLWRAVPVGGAQRAAGALERAADVAIRRVAFAAAEELLGRAVELRRATATSVADHEAELVAIHRLLAVARARRYFAAASTPQLIERAKDLAARTGRQDLLADVLWVEWSAAVTACRIEEGERLSASFVGLLQASPDPDHQAFAEDALAIRAWQAGRIGEAVAHLERAASIRPQRPGVDPSIEFAGERQILGKLFSLLMHSLAGDEENAGEWYEDLMDKVHDRFVLTEVAGFAAVVAECVGDWDRAERIGRRIQELDRDGDFSFYSSMALMALAVTRARRGEVDEGRPMFEGARARYLGVGGGSGLACHDASWALALAHAGRPEEAVAAAAVARRTLERLDERWNEPLVLMAEGAAAHAQGDLATAAQALARAVRVATDQGAHGLARRGAAMAGELGVPL